MRPLGLNILSEGADPVNETEAIRILRELRPHAVVVMQRVCAPRRNRS